MPVQKAMRWISIVMLAVVVAIWVAATRHASDSPVASTSTPQLADTASPPDEHAREAATANPAIVVGVPTQLPDLNARIVELNEGATWTESRFVTTEQSLAEQKDPNKRRDFHFPFDEYWSRPPVKLHMPADIIGLPPEMELEAGK